MDEQAVTIDLLIGHLCGALEYEELLIVEKSLDGELRRKIEILRFVFRLIECDREECCPPEGLAKWVLQQIRERTTATPSP